MRLIKLLRRLLPKKRKKKSGKYPHYAGRKPPPLESKGGSQRQAATSSKRSKRPRRRSAFRQFLRKALVRVTAVGALIGALIYLTLPDIDDLNTFTKAPSILVKAENGQIVGSFGDIYGDYVGFDELPASLIDAVMATEDRNFFDHFGIDPFGLLRAMVANVRAGKVVQGGSTITQQVAKNVFLTPERSFTRKLREMMLALKLERRFSKQDIMSIYLNRVYLGAGNYGVDAASRRYFDKSAREMTLSESAIIAGLLKAPSRFAPTSNPALSRKRADQVLVNMLDAEYLTPQQAQRAREDLAQAMGSRKRNTQSAMYFADWIADQLPDYIGNVQDDLVVIATIDPDLQLIGEKAIAEIMDAESEKYKAQQAALVAMTPNGAVRVLIGGRSYAASQYNRATQAQRQPGSSFKIFVYLAGLESGLAPDTLVEDEPVGIPIVGGIWHPRNYTGRYLGTVTLREAVTHSINTVAVQVAQVAGLDNVINVARRLGIGSELEPLPSIALGSTEVNLLEMTTAYAHLSANGAMVNPYGIVRIETTRGDLIYERRTSAGGGVLAGNIVGMMNDMLMNVINEGTGRAATIGRPAAGKTGTTSDYRDAWFMGYTPALTTGVWVGNDDNSAMNKVTGGTLPARIWHDFMIPALANTPARSLPTSAVRSALPWENDSAGVPLSAEEERRLERRKDVELGPSFWDKLTGR
jgi:penicillin-binding protein 1A